MSQTAGLPPAQVSFSPPETLKPTVKSASLPAHQGEGGILGWPSAASHRKPIVLRRKKEGEILWELTEVTPVGDDPPLSSRT